jgi:hypothetical protein
MPEQDYTTTITVDKSPQAAFEAITNPRAWWGREIEGRTDQLGEEWSYRYQTIHYSLQKTLELDPGRRVVWYVVDGELSFVADKHEWKGTEIVFEISEHAGKTRIQFTHRGLRPTGECYETCSGAWSGLIRGSLRKLIETGVGAPDNL